MDGAAQSIRRLGEGRSGCLALAFVSAAWRVAMTLRRRLGEIPPPAVQHFLRLAQSTPEPDVPGRRVTRPGTH